MPESPSYVLQENCFWFQFPDWNPSGLCPYSEKMRPAAPQRKHKPNMRLAPRQRQRRGERLLLEQQRRDQRHGQRAGRGEEYDGERAGGGGG